MNQLKPTLPAVPRRMQKLHIEERGYPTPWFVQWIEGKPDFRVMDAAKRVRAVNEKLCWLCGEPLGVNLAFLIGPMCAINLVSAEPPSHRDCAEFAVKACPFLAMPKMVRRESGLPENYSDQVGGVMIKRNPGVILLWITKGYRVVKDDEGFVLRLGAPTEVAWYREGRFATRAEVLESIESGLPALQGPIEAETDLTLREYGLQWLALAKARALELLPAETPCQK